MRLMLNKIQLHNFMSFEDATLDLHTAGYTLVRGYNQNTDDFAISNGSGKSSIWEAISWCLTGETIRGTKEVKRIGALTTDLCYVELDFSVDNVDYKLRRIKDPSNLKFYVGEKDISGKGIRDTEKILKETLPNLNSSLIGSVVILGQGLPQRFTNNTPSGRKEVLEKLSRSDFMIEELKTRVATRKAEIQSSIKELELGVASFQGSLSSKKQELESTKQSIEDLSAVSNIDEIIRNCQDYEDSCRVQASENETKYTDASKELEKASNDFNNLKNEFNQECLNIKFSFEEKLGTFRSNLSSLETALKLKKRELDNIKNIKTVCPTCGQKLQGVVKPDTTPLEQEISSLQEQLNDVKDSILKTEEEKSTQLKSTEAVYSERMSAATESQRIASENARKYQQELAKSKSELEKASKNLADWILQKKVSEEVLQGYKDAIPVLEKEIADLNQKILYNNSEIDIFNQRLDIVNKFNNILSRDFRGYLLIGVIDYICKKAKEYSKIVFKTEKINFTLDGNNIEISYDDKPYEALSGGEKQKVDLIIQFAIRDMLCKYLNFSCNMIVLDEIFDNLDAQGCQSVLDLISAKLNDVLNIFIVTHHTDIAVPCDCEVVVTKGVDKISRIM